jgi:hypothetical protein
MFRAIQLEQIFLGFYPQSGLFHTFALAPELGEHSTTTY